MNNNEELKSEMLPRRRFLRSGATFLTAISAPAAVSSAVAGTVKMPESMLTPGGNADEYGNPSVYESDVKRLVTPQNGMSALTYTYAPLHQQKGTITPSGLHFSVHHSGLTDIDPDSHSLYIHGLTEKALKFSVSDLLRYPMVGGHMFLECSGNTWPQAVFPNAEQKTLQELYGLVSGSEWYGVSLRRLLEEAGVKPGAKWVIAEGSDAGSMARSIPLERIMDDAIIALYQNGERLRPSQGYPMRLFMPGLEGNVSVKWLRRLEVTDRPAYTQNENRSYSDTLGDGRLQNFSLYMGVKSVITHPSAGQQLPDKGYYEIAGLAWSGFGKVKAVEVSVDGGKNWLPAKLDGPVHSKSLTRFSLPWKWTGEPVQLQSRAMDDYSNVQPTHAQWRKSYYQGSPKHYNAIQTWHIDQHGGVNNAF